MMTSLVLHGGKIVTVDKSFSIEQAVAITGDRIEMVGSHEAVKRLIGPATKVIDLGGKTVVPGLIDGHAHMDRQRCFTATSTRLRGAPETPNEKSRPIKPCRANRPCAA